MQFDSTGSGGWVAVVPNQEVAASEIAVGRLRFLPDPDESGIPYATIGWTVGDGVTFSASAYTLTVSVTNVNDAPTGSVTISGTAQENQVLTASNTLADADGLGTISYQWQRDGGDVAGATGTTYTLGDADVGHTINVVAKYTDGHGTAEAVASAATSSVTNVNDAPTGSVTISGTAQENQVLTASNTLADADGLGTISYQWQRDGGDVAGATGTTYTLGDADVGHTINVVAKYTDGQGTAEAVASVATSSVTNVNDAPTGSVTISGDGAGEPGSDGVEHAGGCRRARHHQLPMAAQRG